MGSIKADVVTNRASVLVEDRTKKHWPDSELLGWLNDGQLAVVTYRPDAYTVSRVVQLAEGTKQAVPAADLRMIDVPRNMGQDGLTPGRSVRLADRGSMDLAAPVWHNETPGATVRHWMYDQRVPKIWWCYPPQPATSRGYVEMFVSAVPPTMTIAGIDGAAATSVLGIDDIWLNALLQFTVYRAYSKDAEYAQPGGKAQLAFREFLQILGVKTEVDKQFDPSASNVPKYLKPVSGHVGPFGGAA